MLFVPSILRKRYDFLHFQVVNPYGSTAGAGSGEFHVYRHARSREMMRIQQLDEEDLERKADEEFWKKVKADQEIELKKTEQRRKKRQREKEARMKKKVMKLNGLIIKRDKNNEDSNSNFEDEFEYTPMCSSPQENSLVPTATKPTDLASFDQIEQQLG